MRRGVGRKLARREGFAKGAAVIPLYAPRGCTVSGAPPVVVRDERSIRVDRVDRVDQAGFMCLFTSAVISNIETWFLPPKIGRSFSSALMARRFCWSCSPLRLM